MAPLPENGTARWKYTYQNGLHQHSITFRAVQTSTTAEIDAIFQGIITSLGPAFVSTQVTSLEKALLGSDVFLPVAGSTVVGTSFGSGATIGQQDALSIGFVGRGDDGRRARLFLFGWNGAVSNFRLTPAENSSVGDVVAQLNTVAIPLLTISGSAPVWNAYANIQYNDHWVKKSR